MARRLKKANLAEVSAGLVLLLAATAFLGGHGKNLVAPLLLGLGAVFAFAWIAINRKSLRVPQARAEARPERIAPRFEPTAEPIEVALDYRTPKAELPPIPAHSWSLELIRSLEWRRFELLCEEFWRALDYDAQGTGAGADGGVDINLYRPSAPGKLLAVVQCKSHIREAVGVSVVRELFGVMHHLKAPMGIVMTSSFFYPEASRFAEGKHLQLIDGPQLLQRILSLPQDKQATLLAKIASGDYQTPTCPSCDVKMVRRSGKAPRPDFWGCSNFPQCRYTLTVRVPA